MSFCEERARLLRSSNEEDRVRFRKAPDCATGKGELYEDGCASLLFLRCLRAGLPFSLSAGDADGGAFDDLVLHWEDGRSPSGSALFVQLKNITSEAHPTIGRDSLLDPKGKPKGFYIKKYYDSYNKIRVNLGGDNYSLILYTNIDLDESAQCMFVRHDPDPWMTLLQTGGCCYKLNAGDEGVMRAVKSDAQFVQNFYLFCNQCDSTTIMSEIHAELKELLGVDGNSCTTMTDQLCRRIREWNNDEKFALTREWRVWQSMVDSYTKDEKLPIGESLKSLGTQIKDRCVKELQTIERKSRKEISRHRIFRSQKLKF